MGMGAQCGKIVTTAMAKKMIQKRLMRAFTKIVAPLSIQKILISNIPQNEYHLHWRESCGLLHTEIALR
jgi:hypothetical protein